MPRQTTTAADRLKYEDIHAILAETCDGLGVGEETRARIMHPPRKIDETALVRALQTAYQWGLAAALASLPDDNDETQEDETTDATIFDQPPPAEETTPERPPMLYRWQDRWTNDSGL